MAVSETIDALVAVAHDLWRARMAREGWRPGPRYDAGARIHDAIGSFQDLDAADRDYVRQRVEASGLPDRLAALIDYPRGPDRPIRLTEVKRGLPVRLASADDSPGTSEDTGQIHSWMDDGERLTLVRVVWSDGEVTEHVPAARDLERVGW